MNLWVRDRAEAVGFRLAVSINNIVITDLDGAKWMMY
jgi:hypothetical protein